MCTTGWTWAFGICWPWVLRVAKVLWASLLPLCPTLVVLEVPAAESAGRSDVRIGSAFAMDVTRVLRP